MDKSIQWIPLLYSLSLGAAFIVLASSCAALVF